MNTFYHSKPPRSRINITLDVESNGAKRKKELPLRLLVLGSFGQQNSITEIGQREKINATKNNLDSVIDQYSPAISFKVPHRLNPAEKELGVNLQFRHLSDFNPDQLIQQIPEMKRLMAMRNLLKDLRANLCDHKSFKQLLEKIIQNPSSIAQLEQELKALPELKGGPREK